MLVRFLSCRERFRLKYILGLELPDRWNHRIGYGNMWHACEEALAAGKDYHSGLQDHGVAMMERYPFQREEIEKWWKVCMVQFPEYVKYWSEHHDVQNRTPLLQEQVFDVPYRLPSGRVVRLRGKQDSVDKIIDEVTGPVGGVYLQENKTKGDVDKIQVERQLKFDLQTMLYAVGLIEWINEHCQDDPGLAEQFSAPFLGVRYNVVRRPLSGGVGNIKPHSAKGSKNKYTPAETSEEFYERLRREYIAAEPYYWFFRVRAEISANDIQVFKDTCLDPLLETVCCWYDQITGELVFDPETQYVPPFNYRTPFGVYSVLEKGGATEYDACLETGSEAGLRRVETMFPELQ